MYSQDPCAPRRSDPPSAARCRGINGPWYATPACMLLIALLTVLAGCQAGAAGVISQDGDLLFQDLDGGPLCEAIEAVTQGRDGANFSHVGIVAWDGRQCTVIEAGSRGVRITPLEKFLARSADAHGRPKVIVGRLCLTYRKAIGPALAAARGLVGRPYDDEFRLGNGKYYCSELVYETYLDPDSGQRLFDVAPMTFCLPHSRQTLPTWREYFARREMPVPEGQPGCNPGGLSRSEKIEIVHRYGQPSTRTLR